MKTPSVNGNGHVYDDKEKHLHLSDVDALLKLAKKAIEEGNEHVALMGILDEDGHKTAFCFDRFTGDTGLTDAIEIAPRYFKEFGSFLKRKQNIKAKEMILIHSVRTEKFQIACLIKDEKGTVVRHPNSLPLPDHLYKTHL